MSGALCICSVQLRQSRALRNTYAGLPYLADAGARSSNSSEFSTEQTGRHSSQQQHDIRLVCVDTSTQISKKRQTQALLLILQSGTLPVVFITHTCNSKCMWGLPAGGRWSKTGSEPWGSRNVSSGKSWSHTGKNHHHYSHVLKLLVRSLQVNGVSKCCMKAGGLDDTVTVNALHCGLYTDCWMSSGTASFNTQLCSDPDTHQRVE